MVFKRNDNFKPNLPYLIMDDNLEHKAWYGTISACERWIEENGGYHKRYTILKEVASYNYHFEYYNQPSEYYRKYDK